MFIKSFYAKVSRYILKWLIINLILGFIGSLSVMILQKGIDNLINLFYKHYFFSPILGSVLVGVIIFYIDERAAGLGTDIYINYTKENNKLTNPFRLVVSKMIATGVTSGLIGIGGLVGPLLLIGSSLAITFQRILNWFKIQIVNSDLEFRVLSICGAAATLGPLLGAPIGGGVFASEVLYKSSVEYNDLFPAILGSSFGYFFYYSFLPYHRLELNLALPEMGLKEFFLLILVALISGLIGQSFVLVFNLISRGFSILRYSTFLKAVISGGFIFILGLIFKLDLLFDFEIINHLFLVPLREKEILLLVLIKILATMIIIGGGGSAAIVDTALISGALTGNLLYYIFPQIPLQILVIIGLSATLASIANVPLATIILTTEIFQLNLSLPIVIGSIIGFLIGRPKAVFKYIRK